MKTSIFSIAAFLSFAAAASPALEAGFLNPPHDAKPHTWWHWMNGNVSKEGITADLEAMAAIGIGGAQIFDAGCSVPEGPVAFNTPEWFDSIKHAAAEARRLGIELCLPNCSGWSSSGGPWNPPENAMKKLVWTQAAATGGTPFAGKLPRPRSALGFYRDVAVFAVPNPDLPPSARNSGAKVSKTANGATLFELPAPYRAAGVSFRFRFKHLWSATAKAKVEASDDGKTFRTVFERSLVVGASGSGDKARRFHPLPEPASAKFFRVSIDVSGARGVAVEDLDLDAALEVPDHSAKIFAVRAVVAEERPKGSAPGAVPKGSALDLAAKMRPDGSLDWTPPPGKWTIYRLGYAATGQRNFPASKFGSGPEVDKLCPKALDFHFEAYAGKLCRHLGPLAGNVQSGLNNILVDSYEVGSQNWTHNFGDEFRKRAGYPIEPYFPALVGRVVGSLDETERFLHDFRRTVADLFAENYSGALARKCREYGLKLSLEAYGNCPADNLRYGRSADIPMGEFWSGAGTGIPSVGNARFPAYLAHVWGRKIAATESFTAGPGSGRWQKDPFGLKAQGDRVYTHGVNRIIYHRFAHQPWTSPARLPGMTMGMFGMHFDRTQTWWPLARNWIAYQTRCQYLLQEGSPVAEALFYCGETTPNNGGSTDGVAEKPVSLPYGWNWDVCAADALLALRAEGGKVVAPGGVRYAMLVLPDSDAMSLPVLRKIADLAAAGAKIVGRVRPVRTPGLAGYPSADAEVDRISAALWKDSVLACSADEALARLGIEPDFVWPEKKGRDLSNSDVAYIHRSYGAAGDGYFVAMPNPAPTAVECSFRVSGLQPELWNPETGSIAPAPVWREENGRTAVRLEFPPSGSVFVMFRKPASAPHATEVANVKANRAPDPEEGPAAHPELEILSAVYGDFGDMAPARAVDAKKLLEENRGKSIPVTSEFFGKDPALGTPKTLLADYTENGTAKRATVREFGRFAVPSNAVFNYAYYGDVNKDWRPVPPRTCDVTRLLAAKIKNGRIRCAVGNGLAGRDPAPLARKKSVIEFRADGVARTVTLGEDGTFAYPPPPPRPVAPPDFTVEAGPGGEPVLRAFSTLEATLKFPGGAERKVSAAVPPARLVPGPWKVAFDPALGGPASATFPRLSCWTASRDPGVKYYSGAATYRNSAECPKPAPGSRLWLDLGVVKNFAEVKVNGSAKGVLWKPPFLVDVTDEAASGRLDLEIRVTNLWPNRLIGDDFLPEDCKWNGNALAEIPQWVKDGQKSPTGRLTFTTWKHWTKNDAPLPSGLIGPVLLRESRTAK